MDIVSYNKNEEGYRIYCLESVDDVENFSNSETLNFLEFLALEKQITNVYQVCDHFEGLEKSISNLLYADKYFNDYRIIYLDFNGDSERIEIDGYFYTMEEIAELFEGKLKGKIIHFSNKKIVDLPEETFQYFLDVTGAKALSGYTKKSHIASKILDQHFFEAYKNNDEVVDLVEELIDKQAALCNLLGFQMYY